MTRATDMRGPVSRAPLSGTWVETLLEFMKWSQGQQALEPALEFLARTLDAEAVCFSRRDRTKPGMRVVKILDRNSDPRKPFLSQSFALDILSGDLDKLKAGAFLQLSEVMTENATGDTETLHWMQKRGVRDIGLVCLGSWNGTRDLLEIHFCRAPSRTWTGEAEAIAASLAEVFKTRKPGIVEQHLLTRSAGRARRPADHPIELVLGPDNVMGLTRTEWRLCLMIANGLSKDGAARELCVTENTLRTHLRNIYSKTGFGTFHELARRLVSLEEQQALRSAFSQQAA